MYGNKGRKERSDFSAVSRSITYFFLLSMRLFGLCNFQNAHRKDTPFFAKIYASIIYDPRNVYTDLCTDNRHNKKKKKRGNYLRQQTYILYRPIISAIVKPWRAGAGLGGGGGGCGVGALGGLATSLSRSLLRSLSLFCSISRSLSRSRSWSSSSTLEGPGELILRR